MSPGMKKIGDVVVPGIGFGVMGLGGAFLGKIESTDEERLQVLDRAFEIGCTHWDTANIYGDSETLIGEWFRRNPDKRSKVFLATKFGWGSPPTYMPFDGSPANVKASIDASLNRLNTNYVDLYYAHRVDPKVPIEVTVHAMADLVRQGKVRYLGLSECSATALRRACTVHAIAAVQVEYSPFTLDIEDPKLGLLAACKELGATVVAYSPLGRGFLTGQYKSLDEFPDHDVRKSNPRYQGDGLARMQTLVAILNEIGNKHGATSGQVALAWILAQADNMVAIPGTSKLKYLEENFRGNTLELSDNDVSTIRRAANAANVHTAARTLDQHMVYLQQDSPPLPE